MDRRRENEMARHQLSTGRAYLQRLGLPRIQHHARDLDTELGIDLYDETARDRLEVLFWQLAEELLRLAQSVILESGFWLRSERDEKRIRAQGLGVVVELHYLDVPFDERWLLGIERSRLPAGQLLFRDPADPCAPSEFDIVVMDRPDDVPDKTVGSPSCRGAREIKTSKVGHAARRAGPHGLIA